MAKQKENYLDYVPKHNSLFEFRDNKKGHVEIKVHNKGLFNRIAQLIAKKPKYSYIELDEFGTYIWRQIDGVRSIYDIGQLVKQHFGEKGRIICMSVYASLQRYFIKIMLLYTLIRLNKNNINKMF